MQILRKDFGVEVRLAYFELTNVSARALTEYTGANYHAPPEHVAICHLTRPRGATMSDQELEQRIAKAMEILVLEPFFNPLPSVKTMIDLWGDGRNEFL